MEISGESFFEVDGESFVEIVKERVNKGSRNGDES